MVSLKVTVDLKSRVVSGVPYPIPTIVALWVILYYLITAISWIVVGESKLSLSILQFNLIIYVILRLLLELSGDSVLSVCIQYGNTR